MLRLRFAVREIRWLVTLAGVGIVSVCASPPAPEPPVIPTDGVHISGGMSGLYPITSGGTCSSVAGGLTVSANPRPGEPAFGAVVANFTGPNSYTDVQLPPSGHSTLYVSDGGRTWRAQSGLISVKSYGNGEAAGTVWSAHMSEVDGTTTANAAGSWTCRILPPAEAPSPSPSPSQPVLGGPSPTPAGTPVARQALPPATDMPVAALCSTPIQNYADGNAGPLFCKGGEVNVLAWRFYADVSSSILGLGLNPTPGQAQGAMCDDIKRSHATGPEETSAYRLAFTYYGWSFNVDAAHLTCQ